MRRIVVEIERLPHGRDLPLPAYATEQSAGLDLFAALEESAAIELAPGERVQVPTGIRIALPSGHEGQVRPRSGLALRTGLTLLNSPGTIDADYRGEIRVLLVNLGDRPVRIERGMRIAQLVVAPITRAELREQFVDPESTSRGEGGFGSTGSHGDVNRGDLAPRTSKT